MEELAGVPQVVFEGRVLSVRVDPVRAKSGPGIREVVVRPGAVAVVAENSRGEVVLIRQYRWAVGKHLIEIPAGLIDDGESPEEAARRELAEETGYRARQWSLLSSFYTSPGYSTEQLFLFHARDLTLGEAEGDPDEEISVEHWEKNRVRKALASGQFSNGILLVGLLWWLSPPGLVGQDLA